MKVLVCDGIDRAAVEALRAAGHDVEEKSGLAGDALAQSLRGCAGLVVRGATKVTAAVLSETRDLRVVVRAGTGLDNIDRDAAKARGVEVRNTPGANGISVAELTFGLLLAFERHLAAASRDLAAGRWEKKKYAGRELCGKRLGLVGFGRIGREVAQRARAFAMEVWACDPLLQEWPADFRWVKSVTLSELLPAADYVSLHVPLAADTRHIIGAPELARMKGDAVLVNCARGGTVDETALADALKAGRLRGAALDVFAQEPPGDHPLLSLPNVIATPHLGASTGEAQQRAGLEAAAIVIEVLGRASVGAPARRG